MMTVRLPWPKSLSALLPCLLAGATVANADEPASARGIVPEGMWALNPTRSHSLSAGRQTLWVIKDDGARLVWASVTIDDRHRVQVVSYDGAYGGEPAPVVGTPMTTQIVAAGPASLHNYGTIKGMGSYDETCVVSDHRMRFRCEGQVETAKGPRHYVDDFDWSGASPPSARP